MADEADSKSVVGNHVRVQVPPPALKNPVNSRISRKECDYQLNNTGKEYPVQVLLKINRPQIGFFFAQNSANTFEIGKWVCERAE
jgi:hypothetical protein